MLTLLCFFLVCLAPQVHAISYPNETIYLTNNQSTGTSAGFQQLISLSSSQLQNASSSRGNVRFYANDDELTSWYQGNNEWFTVVGTPANSTTKVTVVFLPLNTTYDGVVAGENASLSTIYGEYDNGKFVFNVYDNFDGHSSGNFQSSSRRIDSIFSAMPYTNWTLDDGLIFSYSNTTTIFGQLGGIWANNSTAWVGSSSNITIETDNYNVNMGLPQSYCAFSDCYDGNSWYDSSPVQMGLYDLNSSPNLQPDMGDISDTNIYMDMYLDVSGVAFEYFNGTANKTTDVTGVDSFPVWNGRVTALGESLPSYDAGGEYPCGWNACKSVTVPNQPLLSSPDIDTFAIKTGAYQWNNCMGGAPCMVTANPTLSLHLFRERETPPDGVMPSESINAPNEPHLSVSISPDTSKSPLPIMNNIYLDVNNPFVKSQDSVPIVLTFQNTGNAPAYWSIGSTVTGYPGAVSFSQLNGVVGKDNITAISGTINTNGQPDNLGAYSISIPIESAAFPAGSQTETVNVLVTNVNCTRMPNPACTDQGQSFFAVRLTGALSQSEYGDPYNFTLGIYPFQSDYGILLFNYSQVANITTQTIEQLSAAGINRTNSTKAVFTYGPNAEFGNNTYYTSVAITILETTFISELEDLTVAGTNVAVVTSGVSAVSGIPFIGYSYDLISYVVEPSNVWGGLSVGVDAFGFGSSFFNSTNNTIVSIGQCITQPAVCYQDHLNAIAEGEFNQYDYPFVNPNTTYENISTGRPYVPLYVIYPDKGVILSISDLKLPANLSVIPLTVEGNDAWLSMSSINVTETTHTPPAPPTYSGLCGGKVNDPSDDLPICGVEEGAFASELNLTFTLDYGQYSDYYTGNSVVPTSLVQSAVVPTTPVLQHVIPVIVMSSAGVGMNNTTFNSSDADFLLNTYAPSGIANFTNGILLFQVPQILEPMLNSNNTFLTANNHTLPINITLRTKQSAFYIYAGINAMAIGNLVLHLPKLRPTISLISQYGTLILGGGSFGAQSTILLQYFKNGAWLPLTNNVVINTSSTGEFYTTVPIPPCLNSSFIVLRAEGENNTTAFTTGEVKYLVKFNEQGLINGTAWSVSVNGMTENTTGTQLLFSLPDGNYIYNISTDGNILQPDNGTLSVNGSNLNVTAYSLDAVYPNVTVYVFNNQSAATGPNFQQELRMNSSTQILQNISSDGGNVRFYLGSQELYSWRENATIWWIKLPNGVPAESTVAVNMTFLSKSIEYDDIYAGEAPQLSSTYGEYDNGENVFGFYDNFAGASLNASKWTILGSSGGYAQDNGITVTGNNGWESLGTANNYDPQTQVAEVHGRLTALLAPNAYSYAQLLAWGPPYAPDLPQFGITDSDRAYSLFAYDSGPAVGDTFLGSTATNQTWSVWQDGSDYYAALDYDTLQGLSAQYAPITSQDFGFGTVSTGVSAVVQYARLRALPPGGVMPKVVFTSSPLAPLAAGAMNVSSALVQYGASVSLESNVNGGILPYAISWYSQPNCTEPSIGTGANDSFIPAGTQTYSYRVIDGIGAFACSPGSTIAVTNIPFYPNVTIYVTNNQSATTGPGFQQMIVTNVSAIFQNISSDGGNVRFYAGSHELYSWRENATVWWVRLSDGIPANSTVAINMTFLPMSTEYDGTYAGEAPQLSDTYAKYDNGRLVFPTLYDNFNGTTLNSTLWQGLAHGNYFTVDNGLAGTGPSYDWAVVDSKTNYDPQIDVLDFFANYSNFANQEYSYKMIAYNPPYANLPQFGVTDSYSSYSLWSYNGGPQAAQTGETRTTSPNLFTLWANDTNAFLTVSYTGKVSVALPSLTSAPIGIAALGGNVYVQYIRLRTPPPNGVMPSVAFDNPPMTTTTTTSTTTTVTTTIDTTHPNVTVYLRNNQSVSTDQGFQQMILVNSSEVFQNISSDGGNVRFYLGQQEIYSWRENATVWWVKLPGGIAPNSTFAMNMTFLPRSTEYDGVYAGEAPQLSETYGQYDNGAEVFTFYDDFAGTSLNASRWSVLQSTSGFSIDDGLTVNGDSCGWCGVVSNDAFNWTSTVFEFRGHFTGFDGLPRIGAGYGLGFGTPDEVAIYDNWEGYNLDLYDGAGSAIFMGSSTSDQIFSVWGDNPEATGYASVNYGQPVYSSAQYPLSYTSKQVDIAGIGSAYSLSVTYARVRLQAPNGVMPSVAFNNPPMTTTTTTSTTSTVTTTIDTAHPNVTVNITNDQDVSTGTDFQQMVSINDSPIFQNISGDGGNVRFYAGSQELHSWRENATIWWVKLPDGIPANSTVAVNMTFLPRSTEYDGTYAGEAPQLSVVLCGYGCVDNGADVFEFYDGFGGTILNASKWQVSIGGSGYVSQDDGVTVHPAGWGVAQSSLTSQAYFNMSNTTIESYSYLTSFFGWYCPADEPVSWNVGGAPGIGDQGSIYGGDAYSLGTQVCFGSYSDFPTSANSTSSPQVFSVEMNSTDSFGFINYTNALGLPTAVSGDGQIRLIDVVPNIVATWVRARTTPPDGIMPQVAFDSMGEESQMSSHLTRGSSAALTVGIGGGRADTSTQVVGIGAVNATGPANATAVNALGANAISTAATVPPPANTVNSIIPGIVTNSTSIQNATNSTATALP